MRHLLPLRAQIFLLLALLACNKEEAQRRMREQAHAALLETELARFQADFARRTKLELPASKSRNLDRLVPEWKSYHDGLTESDRLLTVMIESVAARKVPEIAAQGLDGYRSSSAVAASALAKMRETAGAETPKAQMESPGAVAEFSARLQYYNGVSRLAIQYTRLFLNTLVAVAKHGPLANRTAMFDELVRLQQSSNWPEFQSALAGSLREISAGEDDPPLKARREQKLKDLNLPPAAQQRSARE
jgi:hypothetical protein